MAIIKENLVIFLLQIRINNKFKLNYKFSFTTIPFQYKIKILLETSIFNSFHSFDKYSK
jgi:hypothetical protein